MDLTKGKVSTALLKFTMPIILMQILNQAGIEYINGYTVATSVGFETFASQNIGAKEYDRVKEGYRTFFCNL